MYIMSEISVQFLGSGDAFGSGGRLQTCICVDTGDLCFLLDCGATSLVSMKRWGVDPSRIDVILLTHLHGDHFGGLPFFILDAQLKSKRTRPLVVAGPPGLETRIRTAQEIMFPGSSRAPQRFALQFLELRPSESATIRSLRVTPYPVIHASGAPAYALRVECAGKVIVYSGDTEWTETLLDAAADADLFVCEAYSFDKPIKYHLDYRRLMEYRARLNCRRLMLTHMSDDVLARLPEIDAECSEDGKRIVL